MTYFSFLDAFLKKGGHQLDNIIRDKAQITPGKLERGAWIPLVDLNDFYDWYKNLIKISSSTADENQACFMTSPLQAIYTEYSKKWEQPNGHKKWDPNFLFVKKSKPDCYTVKACSIQFDPESDRSVKLKIKEEISGGEIERI